MKELKDIFQERRSINFFDVDRELEDGVLEKIVALASLTPTAFNLQPYRIIAVLSEVAKKKLHQAAGQPKILEAPVTLIIVGDRNGSSTANPVWAQMRGMGMEPEAIKDMQEMAYSLYAASEERKVKFAESNSGLFAMSLMYAAKYYGVDTHPMSGVDFEKAHELFELKENEDIVMLIGMGYLDTNKQLWPRAPRKSFQELVEKV